ncbi:MAG TPA: PAS domain S-box protein [Pyrinomonadaceae bacterium]|jgi:PAS domain S-box-containing protein
MPEVKRSPLFRYGLAILLVALAAAISWLLQAEHARTPFAFFFIAVVAATLYGGRGPGLLTIALSALFSSYFILLPRFSFAIGYEGLLQLGVFLFVALVISYLAERVRGAEQRARISEASLRTTLQSIGDAVIASDVEGRVTFMNPVAQSLTGWKLEEASGKELREVFHIINEFSRQPVENPVVKVLREGVVVGLANHTLLVSRDGREIPIDDSGAPIKDEDGNTRGVVLVFHDITERRKGEEAALWLAALVESSDDAILAKTLDGVITSWNQGAQRLYGYSAEEVIGQNVSILVPPDRPDELTGILKRLAASERVEHFETVRVTRDGRRIHVSLTISPIKDDGGEIIGASTIARDITGRKEIEEERDRLLAREREARIEAEEANRLKDEFLATLSHELRTPLTAMLGWTRMLRTRQLDEHTSGHALETIERNVRAQTQLIEDLLDVSRIITGKLRLDTRPVELVPVIEAAIDSIRPAAKAKEITLERSLDPTASPVLGDANRLQQVVWNLLSNAVKFTPKGGRIQIALHRNESYAAVTITDSGTGISQDFLPYVFDRFRQADSSSTRAHGGLGLGLAIVRHLVELHGGTVGATSEGTKRGSSFTVELPLMTVNLRRTETAKMGSDGVSIDETSMECPPPLKGVRILVVDDEEDTRHLLATILGECEALVETAANVGQAIEAVRLKRPDLLISDIGMPDEDGYGLVQRLRAEDDPELKELPAVALTAYAGEDDRARSLAAGFQIHLAKPVDPEALIAAVEQLVGKDKS